MMTVEIPWKPFSKERPQLNRKTGSVYTPRPTKLAEKRLAEAFRAEMPDFEPLAGPLIVSTALREDSILLSITEAEHGRLLRGDIDNYAKTILDGLNGVAWLDDNQITGLALWEAGDW